MTLLPSFFGSVEKESFFSFYEGFPQQLGTPSQVLSCRQEIPV